MKKVTTIILLAFSTACLSQDKDITNQATVTQPDTEEPENQNPNNITIDFSSQDHFDSFFIEDTFGTGNSYYLENQILKITTLADTTDRIKIRSVREDFGLGIYTWKIFTSERVLNTRNSMGAFLYNDDWHELDFEIGSGTSADRNTKNAEVDDLLAYCVTQANPKFNEPFLVKHNRWHVFKLKLTLDEATQNYHVEWFIDGELVQTRILDYGLEFLFKVHCSLENLEFIGDNWPLQPNEVLFDYFKYEALDD